MLDNTTLIISLGSNTNQDMNMFLAEHLIEKMLPGIIFTEGLWNEPIGLKSNDKFLNKLAYGTTNHGYMQISRALKHIERVCGSYKAERNKNVIKMDIDILLFGDTKYHIEDWDRPYIKELLKNTPYGV